MYTPSVLKLLPSLTFELRLTIRLERLAEMQGNTVHKTQSGPARPFRGPMQAGVTCTGLPFYHIFFMICFITKEN
jgi:hypothetical protein